MEAGRKSGPVAEGAEVDLYKSMKIAPNPDGSLTGLTNNPLIPTVPTAIRATYKDITYNSAHNAWLRIYQPHYILDPPDTKLPVVIYIHGGGFTHFGADTPLFHAACGEKADEIPSIVVSVNYRLAPEHRLPAAYDDVVDTIKWVRDEWAHEPWLGELADPTRCFIMGTSAGGNIAYYAALQVQGLDLGPVRIAGVILNQPAFGGVERTGSELTCGTGGPLSLVAIDKMWELALPEGSNRDHEYSNPGLVNQPVKGLPRCMVCCYGRDPMVDRQRGVVQLLRKGGVEVVERVEEDGYHGIDYFEPERGRTLLMDIKNFILETK